MNLKFTILIIIGVIGCMQEEPKFVIKKISDNDITIKWYYYSYITNNSPEFVVLEKQNVKKQLFKGVAMITDVSVNEQNIIIKYINPSKEEDYEKTSETKIFGFNIIMDSTGTYDEYKLVPNGIKE